MVCDRCGKQNLMHLENGKTWCSWCNDWARSAEEEALAKEKKRISMQEGLKRCAQCGQMFREAENHDAACSYHTGPLWDCDRYRVPGLGLALDIWEFCGRQIGNDGANVPGCAV